jgi:hypothetical protein
LATTRKTFKNPTKEIVAGAKVFKDFHGEDPQTIQKVRVQSRTMPEVLVVLGKCVAVEYEVEENQSSTRKGKTFRHEFGDTGGRMVNTMVYLATDKGRKQFYLVNAKVNSKYPVFTDRGIVG